MRKIWFSLSLLILAAAGSAIAQAPAPKVDTGKLADLLTVNKDDRVLGQPNAPITIIEYASLTCPHCAHFENEVLPEIEKQWIDTGKARLVMRDFPLDRTALAAETLARCVPPDRFYPLVKSMFADQPAWVQADWRPGLERIAKFAGIGGDQFDACLANKTIENQVAASRLLASTQLGVDATPTFFIDGRKFEGEPTVEGFSKALAAAQPQIANAAPPAAPAQSAAAPAASEPKQVAAPGTATAGNPPAGAHLLPAEPPRSIWARAWGWVIGLFGGNS
jgi:protein-disulfide isomerase